MAKSDNLKKQVPEFVSGISLHNDFYTSIGATLDAYGIDKADLETQLFVDTATWGLRFWEEFVGIVTDATKSLATRRAAIKAKIMGNKTITISVLESILASYGYTDIDLIENALPNVITISANHEWNPANSAELMKSLGDTLPAHLDASAVFDSSIINVDYIDQNNAFIDLYSPSNVYQKQLATFAHDENKSRTISLYNVPSTNQVTAGNKVVLDYFEALYKDDITYSIGASHLNLAVDPLWNSPTRTVSGAWSSVVGPAPDYDGGSQATAAYSYQAFDFDGTGVKLTGVKGPDCGMIKIYVDRYEAGTIDLYSATAKWSELLFEVKGLTPGLHNFQVWIEPTKNVASSSTKVTLQNVDYYLYKVKRNITVIDGTSTKLWTTDTNASHFGGSAITSSRLYEEMTITYSKDYKELSIYGQVGPDFGMLEINNRVTTDHATNESYSYNFGTLGNGFGTLTKDKKSFIKNNFRDISKYDANTTARKWFGNLETIIKLSNPFIPTFDILGLTVDENDNSYFLCGENGGYGKMSIAKIDKNGAYKGRLVFINSYPVGSTEGRVNGLSANMFYSFTNKKIYAIYEDATLAEAKLSMAIIDAETLSVTDTKIVNRTAYRTFYNSEVLLIGEINGDIYTTESYIDAGVDKTWLVRYDKDFVFKNRIQITIPMKNRYYIGNNCLYFSYGTIADAALNHQGVTSPMVVCYNPDLTVKFAAKASLLGVYFDVDPIDNTMYGQKGVNYKTQLNVTKLDPDAIEEWTAVFGHRSLAAFNTQITGPIALFLYDSESYIRVGDKKSLGYKKKFKIFNAGGI